jgi:hypothetical protein
MKKIMMGLIALVMCLSSFKGMAQDVNELFEKIVSSKATEQNIVSSKKALIQVNICSSLKNYPCSTFTYEIDKFNFHRPKFDCLKGFWICIQGHWELKIDNCNGNRASYNEESGIVTVYAQQVDDKKLEIHYPLELLNFYSKEDISELNADEDYEIYPELTIKSGEYRVNINSEDITVIVDLK